MQKMIRLYLQTLLIFFALDMVWLVLVAPGFYQHYLGHVLANEVYWPAAMAFYLLFIAGLQFFAIQPGIQKESSRYAAIHGGLFGLFTYATYDLTNYATIVGWPIEVVIADISWGIIVCASVAGLSSLFNLRLIRRR